jgi:hypothetical protein
MLVPNPLRSTQEKRLLESTFQISIVRKIATMASRVESFSRLCETVDAKIRDGAIARRAEDSAPALVLL